VYTFFSDLKIIASFAVSSAEKAIENASALGVDVREAEECLEKAKNCFDEWEFELAKQYADEAEKIATNLVIKLVEEAIKSAEEVVSNPSGIGANIEDAREFLREAKNALSDGQYKLALDYSEKAKNAASPIMSYKAFFVLIAIIIFVFSLLIYYKITTSKRE